MPSKSIRAFRPSPASTLRSSLPLVPPLPCSSYHGPVHPMKSRLHHPHPPFCSRLCRGSHHPPWCTPSIPMPQTCPLGSRKMGVPTLSDNRMHGLELVHTQPRKRTRCPSRRPSMHVLVCWPSVWNKAISSCSNSTHRPKVRKRRTRPLSS